MRRYFFTLTLILAIAFANAQLGEALTNRIQVQGESSRELVPATINLHISFDDYECSTQYPDIEALNAHYLQCVQAVNIPSSDNILQSVDVAKVDEYGHQREYHTYHYVVVLHDRADALSLMGQLYGGGDYYEGSTNFSIEIGAVEFMDEEVVVQQLIDEAFTSARKKAEQLAHLAERPLGKVIYMQQGTPYDFYSGSSNYEGNELTQRLYKILEVELTIAYELN